MESGPPARPQDVRRFLRWRADNRLDRRGAVVAEPSSLSTIETAASAIAAVHRRQGLRPPITEAVREQLRAQTRQGRQGAEDLALVRLAFDALLRRSEVAAVRWKNVSPEDDGSGRLRVVRAKTGVVQESVYLGPPTMTALDAIRPAEPDNDALVFGLHPDTIGRRLKRVCERAGLGEGWSGHSMRVGRRDAAGTDDRDGRLLPGARARRAGCLAPALLSGVWCLPQHSTNQTGQLPVASNQRA